MFVFEGCVTVGVKDVWKWLFTSFIEERIGKKYDVNSDFFIGIMVSYQDNDNECSCLYSMLPDMFSRKLTRCRQQSNQETFSRKGVEQAMKTITPDNFTKHFPTPPSVPTQSAVCNNVNLEHKSIFIAGRYNKWSRQLPQTPWIIGGERKMESSVQEIISEPLERISKAQGSKFSASGREDVDVRTLGRGRPFSVELLNPKRVKFSFDTMRSLENEINANGSKKIFVRDLQVVSRESLINLKMGEEHKTKEYNAYCIVYGPLPPGLDGLAEKAPITLKQMTPVRVLHRRPVASRERTINWFKFKPVKEDPSYFTLAMNTQAGTYIKEFIHGDLGRTTPSLGELLGGMSVDILALDVQVIKSYKLINIIKYIRTNKMLVANNKYFQSSGFVNYEQISRQTAHQQNFNNINYYYTFLVSI
ncbi:hypothetical protein AAG570_013749 [Ranatra chinensis]|uniref:tRNA pseudouridine(55) synthase n=1 Tax=Ranatra chinensis TaxID=642074 RepID=A0ABD0YD43_9HEMI